MKTAKNILILSFLCLFASQALSQRSTENGFRLPAQDTTRALILFAEVDYADTTTCPDSLSDNLDAPWPEVGGVTQVPEWADSLFDHALTGGEPQFPITKIYHQASFGQYILLADYYPKVFSIPCNSISQSQDNVGIVLSYFGAEDDSNGTIYTKHGYPLADFDLYDLDTTEALLHGSPKVKQSDDKIDVVMVVWRNNRFLTSLSTKCGAGWGEHMDNASTTVFDLNGWNVATSFNACNKGDAFNIILAEHLHGLFGSNHWHKAGGAGERAFIRDPGSYSLTGQAGLIKIVGWDRLMLGWADTANKQYLISANTPSGTEVNTECVTIDNYPNGGTVMLRDFAATGDAIRIKLPYFKHISFQKSHPNAYLYEKASL